MVKVVPIAAAGMLASMSIVYELTAGKWVMVIDKNELLSSFWKYLEEIRNWKS